MNVATTCTSPLVEYGDLQLSRPFVSGDFDEPRVGQHIGKCMLTESGSKLLAWNVYLIGAVLIRSHIHVVGGVPGRDDLFLGRWWSSPVGPRLWRLEGMRLAEALPLDPTPRMWGKDAQIRAALENVCAEVAGFMSPSTSAESDVGAAVQRGYNERVAWLCNNLINTMATKGYSLTYDEIARRWPASCRLPPRQSPM